MSRNQRQSSRRWKDEVVDDDDEEEQQQEHVEEEKEEAGTPSPRRKRARVTDTTVSSRVAPPRRSTRSASQPANLVNVHDDDDDDDDDARVDSDDDTEEDADYDEDGDAAADDDDEMEPGSVGTRAASDESKRAKQLAEIEQLIDELHTMARELPDDQPKSMHRFEDKLRLAHRKLETFIDSVRSIAFLRRATALHEKLRSLVRSVQSNVENSNALRELCSKLLDLIRTEVSASYSVDDMFERLRESIDASLDFDWTQDLQLAPFQRTAIVTPLWAPIEGAPPRAPRVRQQQVRQRDATVRTVAQQKDNTEREDSTLSDKRVQALRELLWNMREPMSIWRVVIDPASFARTVENMFDLAFIIKEGKVQVSHEGDDVMIASARSRDVKREATNARPTVPHQAVVSIDAQRIEFFTRHYNIREAFIKRP